ncbi:MAG: hypothetical protein WC867_01305 [Candidatus Pacearchaeota archaeon]|jgi:hypothetical protein
MTLYDKFDKVATYGANQIVKSWNWTTGGTKSDLAVFLHTSGWGVFTTGVAISNKIFGAMTVPISIGLSYVNFQIFKDQEKLENQFKDKEVKSYDVEKRRGVNFLLGGFFSGLSGVNLLSAPEYPVLGNNQEYISNTLQGCGQTLLALSYYVMNADSLPPRKNCLSRGLDYLVESVESYKNEPVRSRAN